jgi:hypothetical protein
MEDDVKVLFFEMERCTYRESGWIHIFTNAFLGTFFDTCILFMRIIRHQGCECTKEWTGEHCQNPSGVFNAQSSSKFLESPTKVTLLITFSVFAILILYLTIRSIHRERLLLERKRLEERDRCRNLAAGAICDIDEAFNPYESEDDHVDIRDLALTLLWGEEA